MKYGRIIVSAPGPGKCRVCAVRHGKDEPHEAGSVYYIVRFLQKYGHEPTKEDAAAHLKAAGE